MATGGDQLPAKKGGSPSQKGDLSSLSVDSDPLTAKRAGEVLKVGDGTVHWLLQLGKPTGSLQSSLLDMPLAAGLGNLGNTQGRVSEGFYPFCHSMIGLHIWVEIFMGDRFVCLYPSPLKGFFLGGGIELTHGYLGAEPRLTPGNKLVPLSHSCPCDASDICHSLGLTQQAGCGTW